MLISFGISTDGVAATFFVHGVVYAVFMSMGAIPVQVPPEGWRPAGWEPKAENGNAMMTRANVSANNAIKTPQFWLLWIILAFNVTAGFTPRRR